MSNTVTRTNTGHIFANGKCYSLFALVNKAFDIVKASGSNNPAFDMPPWFYTGSPYADAIVNLGCEELTPPDIYMVECVPPLGNVWRSREPAWAKIFNVDVKL
jgi:hypothetical protein